MDLRFSEEYESFRGEVRAFLKEHWPLSGAEAELPPAEQAGRFRERATAAGYLYRSIPSHYGGAEQPPDVLKATVIQEEWRRAHAPGEMRGIGPSMLVPTLIECGSEQQKEKFIRPTLRGDVQWCQGYSEPGSGSDLASLQTRAVLEDGEWVINGHKIWTSGAQHADYMFCLCRTEPDAGKHGGISYLLIDMHQPGIDVRPLRQMTGSADFNEVFLNDVRTPADWIVGKRGEGWIVSRATLKHERNMIGSAEQSQAIFDRLVGLARAERPGGPRSRDPHVRQGLAEIEGYVAAHRYSGYRQLTQAARGRDAGMAPLLNKITSTNLGDKMAKLAYDLIGEQGLCSPSFENMRAGRGESGWVGQYMWSLGMAIGGGTANIQRNVIAERGLGLPRDRAADQRSK